MIVLSVGFFFLAAALIVDDFKQSQGLDVDTSFRDDFNFESSLNTTAGKIKEGAEQLTDPNNGYDLLEGGFQIIWNSIILVPVAIFDALRFAGIAISKIGGGIGIPSEVISYGLTALLIVIVFSFISWWHSKEKV